MGIYLVRHIETKEVQGIFWGSLSEIWDALDELCNPLGFEFARLKQGALYTAAPIGKGKTAMQFDDRPEEDDCEEFSWDGFEPNETFWEDLHFHNKLRWKPFDAAGEGVGLLRRVFDEESA